MKIGMLSQRRRSSRRWPTASTAISQQRIVLDPVMVATSGDRLLAPDAIDALRSVLIPKALVVTPNLPEAAALLDARDGRNESEMQAQAREHARARRQGGADQGRPRTGAESVDLLVEPNAVARLAAERIATQQHPRHRLHAVVGDRGRPRQGPDARRGACARPRPMSPPRSPPRTGSRSVTATGRCIIFTHWWDDASGIRSDHEHHATQPGTRRRARLAGVVAAPHVARAQTRRWRMVTSWPKRLPGPGMSAERVAERIKALSGGRLEITVHAAGEVVPAFEVLDAVGGGVAEMGHTASFYWQGKKPAAAFFTTVPFGLTPDEHVAWVDAGGGQALWDELYAPFGVKPFMGGNTGVCMGGWFRREIKSRDDIRGVEDPLARSGRRGLSPARRHAADHAAGGDPDQPAIRRDRCAPNSSAPAPTSRSGSIAWRRSTTAPGFNKPNGTGECIVSLKAWNALDAEHEGDRRACLRGGGRLRAVRDGAAQHRGAGGADRPAQASS